MESLYMTKSLTNQIYLKRKLYSLKMNEGTKIANHLNVFNTLICQLNSMDVKLDDEDKAVTLLCSLPKSWDHLVTSISFSTIETLEFDNVVGALLSEEVRRKSSIETSTLEAMVARGRSMERGENSSRTSRAKSTSKKGKGRCWYCNKSGHLNNDFWKLQESKEDAKMKQIKSNYVQVDGDLDKPKLPIIPGHEIVGVVDKVGAGVDSNLFSIGKRVGIPWLGRTCGKCTYCLEGAENLCDDPAFTGYQIDGGYAEYAVAHAAYCFPLPEIYSDIEVAPLLCAGLIGYRSLRKTGFKPGLDKKKRIGIYGFGAAAHIIAQVAIHEGHQIYAFTRAGDKEAQAFALRLGAIWAGDSMSLPPHELDAAILFAPVGLLVPAALKAVRKGGIVVAGGIHMSQIPAFPYSILWGERQVVSVANLTRQDALEFLELAPKACVKTETVVFPLDKANEALASLREGRLEGAAVLVP